VCLGYFVPVFFRYIKKRREDNIEKNTTELSIAGDWSSVFAEGSSLKNEIIKIDQKGRQISATIKMLDKSYSFFGEFKNQILTGSYHSKSAKQDERGMIVLRYINENLLSGYCTFIYKSRSVYNSSYVLSNIANHKADKGTYSFCNGCVGKFDCCCNCENIDMPLLLPFEAERIAIISRTSIDNFAEKLRQNSSIYQMKRSADTSGCPFFVNKKCTIYENRPIDCRLFPFDFRQIDSEFWIIYYSDVCQAIPNAKGEIDACAHNIRPMLDIVIPYMAECVDPIYSEKLSKQPYSKLFPVREVATETWNMK
jgi:Fe-S-cluster containining protein